MRILNRHQFGTFSAYLTRFAYYKKQPPVSKANSTCVDDGFYVCILNIDGGGSWIYIVWLAWVTAKYANVINYAENVQN